MSQPRVHAADGAWNVDAGGNWSVAGNWLDSIIADGAGSTGYFTNNITGNRVITINTTSRTLGSLQIGDANNSHTFAINSSGGAGLTFDNNGSGATVTETGGLTDTISAPVTLADNLTVNASGQLSLNGAIGESGGSRAIVKNGSGVLLLGNANSFSGGVTLNAGTLILGSNSTVLGTGPLTINAGTLSIGSAGTFTTTSNTNYWNANFILSRGSTGVSHWTNNGTVFLGANVTITVANNTMNLIQNEVIEETGGSRNLQFGASSSTITLNAANTYSGTTTLTGGNLVLGNNLAIQNSPLNTATGGNLILGTGVTTPTFGGLTGSTALGTRITAATYALVTDLTLNTVAGTDVTYSGVIANGAAGMTLTKTGAGIQSFTGTGNNTYTGLTTVNAGELRLGKTGSANAMGGSLLVSGGTVTITGTSGNQIPNSADLTVSGGTFDLVNQNETVNGVTLTSGTITSGSGVLTSLTTFDIQAGTAAARLGGTVGLTKTTTGVATLSGNNTYSGATTVNAGRLLVNGSTAASSTVTVNSGGSVGGTGTINGLLQGAGSVDPGNSPGILTASQVDPTSSMTFNFEVTNFGTIGSPADPDYSNASASLNDVLRLTHATTPFTADLTLANVVNLYLSGNVIGYPGTNSFRAGFFTDRDVDFIAAVTNATYNVYVASVGGPVTYLGQQYAPAVLSYFSVSTVPVAAFGGGYITQFDLAIVPEPSSIFLLLCGGWMLIRYRRQRRSL